MSCSLSIVLCLVDAIAGGISGSVEVNAAQLRAGHTTIYEAQVREVASLSEVAVSVMERFHWSYLSGEMTLEEAQEQARNVIRDLRYRDNAYFFALDYDGVLVIHPVRPELEGTSVIDVVDPNGVLLFREMIDAGISGGGVVDFHWTRAGSDTPIPKIGYAAPFEPWGWIVGTSVYVDDPDVTFWGEALRAMLRLG